MNKFIQISYNVCGQCILELSLHTGHVLQKVQSLFIYSYLLFLLDKKKLILDTFLFRLINPKILTLLVY